MLRETQKPDPTAVVTVNVYGASAGSYPPGRAAAIEGASSGLTERGHETPAIVNPPLSSWTPLSGPQRKAIGDPGRVIYDCGASTITSR